MDLHMQLWNSSHMRKDSFKDPCNVSYSFLPTYLNCACVLFGPRRKKTCLRGFANNTSADQPAHPRSLISAFVVRFLESIIRKLASGEI